MTWDLTTDQFPSNWERSLLQKPPIVSPKKPYAMRDENLVKYLSQTINLSILPNQLGFYLPRYTKKLIQIYHFIYLLELPHEELSFSVMSPPFFVVQCCTVLDCSLWCRFSVFAGFLFDNPSYDGYLNI